MRTLAQTDADSELSDDGNFVISPDYKYASVKADRAVEIFGDDATGSDRDTIGKSLIREPLAPMGMPVKLTAQRFGNAPKHYIETTQDVVVSTALQERMMQGAKIQQVFKIEAGHASYTTQPGEVAKAIVTVAQEQRRPAGTGFP